jgi:hypothetical protein
MPNFDPIFMETVVRPILYKGNSIARIDKFPIKNGDILIASIETTNSQYRQGFSIDIKGYCEMNGKVFKQGKGILMLFWEDTMPKQVEIKVFTKQDFVIVQNMWEENISFLEDQEKQFKLRNASINGAAMIVEEIENGRRYRCNDGVPDEDFDDIIFTVQRLKT